MEFNHQYNFKPSDGEVLDEESFVETAGYISSEKRIQNIMLAGAAITRVTSGQFDYQDFDPNWAPDPTRRPGYDLVDAQRDMARANAAQDALRQAQEAAKAPKTAPEGSTNPPAVETPPKAS